MLSQETVSEDRIARRELKNLKNYEIEQLNEAVFKQLFGASKNVQWVFKGKTLLIANRTQFNKQLSKICKEVYEATPIFKNELVNRSKISGSIATARRNYFKALTKDWQKENLGFSETAFPPEKRFTSPYSKKQAFTKRAMTIITFWTNLRMLLTMHFGKQVCRF